ncbi:hypothetical protein TTHERM_00320280 (macronuclear) [Tetrahymena thermophila SB210]|uniref:Uncharacterized protein n=1 Tax=Tetrahymena thermophila (strain SB210) TaxID=312017 RepID=Q237Q9_TETTS|nr:hypothetical protein TTHERM_00320280 [Tetrahymena thermophila SB210]EAR92682.2 hypothetical protein TTHERM_00320280 [Tetrahymena thermophila SB210]|eukprot:XP_001012927.2 hypothetical protein TTHERM_00320280 [Tetrahymena thermophila SB210]
MSNFTLDLYFKEDYPEQKLKQLQQLIRSKARYHAQETKNKGKNIFLNVNASKDSKEFCDEVIKLFRSFQDSEEFLRQCLYQVKLQVNCLGEDRNFLILIPVLIYDFMKQITDVSFEFQNTDITSKNIDDLTNIFKMFRYLESFTIKCNEQICFQNNQQLELFCNSLSPLITNLKYFQILNNRKEKNTGYTISIPSNFTTQISKLLTNCKMLKCLKLDFAYMGWDRERIRYIPQNILTNLLMYCDQWPDTLNILEINFDRMTYQNSNVDFYQVQFFLIKLTALIRKQADLEEFSFDLSGFNPFNNQDISKQLIQLSEELKNVRKLSLQLGGHFKLSAQDWKIFLKNISSIKNLVRLNLNIEFWKDFVLNNPCKKQYHTSIIQEFINNLINNHKFDLESLSFNTDDWFFLNNVEEQNIINQISQFQNLNELTLLFYKSKSLNYYKIQQFEQQVKQGSLCKNNQPSRVQLPQIQTIQIKHYSQNETPQKKVSENEVNTEQIIKSQEKVSQKKSSSKKLTKKQEAEQYLKELLSKHLSNQTQNENSIKEDLKKKYLSSQTE